MKCFFKTLLFFWLRSFRIYNHIITVLYINSKSLLSKRVLLAIPIVLSNVIDNRCVLIIYYFHFINTYWFVCIINIFFNHFFYCTYITSEKYYSMFCTKLSQIIYYPNTLNFDFVSVSNVYTPPEDGVLIENFWGLRGQLIKWINNYPRETAYVYF